MKINKIALNNFRIYKGVNEIDLTSINPDKNINIIAGRNGFGKTTFLTSLIWCFYGKMMGEVEEKYKRDIRSAGGYEKYMKSLINKEVANDFKKNNDSRSPFFVEVSLVDIAIPSIPCESLSIKRSFDIVNGTEQLQILIDGVENELAKEVGLELFINDFILPREIAKFFFFDAEKIVSLAEAKSESELQSLSRAYSEVLGIKKYEDLKKNLETLLTKLQRNGAKPVQQNILNILLQKELDLKSLLEHNLENKINLEKEIVSYTSQSEYQQEKLIREGSGISVEDLALLKDEQKRLKDDLEGIKTRLKKMMDLLPIVMAGKRMIALITQLENEAFATNNFNFNISDNSDLTKLILKKLNDLNLDNNIGKKIISTFENSLEEFTINSSEYTSVLLDYAPQQSHEVKAVLDNIRSGFNIQFQNIVKEEKNNRIASSRILYKIKQAEARKNNVLAQKIRMEKLRIDTRLMELNQEKGHLIAEIKNIEQELTTNKKNISELQKHFNIMEIDLAKSKIVEKLLEKTNSIIQRVKEEKKYALQKSVLLGLKKLMHKKDFIKNVHVNVKGDVMDITLIGDYEKVIDKDLLSKGEQQLYATALLKALVDQSGIQFPVFIDSPLQKFDKLHSENIIKEFYPSISEQVVLFPLLEKELSKTEYNFLLPNLNKVYLIDNEQGFSTIKPCERDQLFNEVQVNSAYVHSN